MRSSTLRQLKEGPAVISAVRLQIISYDTSLEGPVWELRDPRELLGEKIPTGSLIQIVSKDLRRFQVVLLKQLDKSFMVVDEEGESVPVIWYKFLDQSMKRDGEELYIPINKILGYSVVKADEYSHNKDTEI